MEWLSMVLKILIVISSLSFFAKIPSSMSMHVNYVKPFGHERASKSPQSDVQRPCLTLNEYASNSDEYFVNTDTRFYFYPGIHRLEFILNLVNLYNISQLGWSKFMVIRQLVTMAVDSSVSIIVLGTSHGISKYLILGSSCMVISLLL